MYRAAALEKEKKDMECCLQKRVQEFEAEKENLQTCISSMTEDLRTRAEVQEKADQLQVVPSKYLSWSVTVVSLYVVDLHKVTGQA